MQRHVREAMRQNGARKRLNLGEERGPPAERMPSGGRGLNAGTDGAVDHCSPGREQIAERTFALGLLEVQNRLPIVGGLQLCPNETPPHLERLPSL